MTRIIKIYEISHAVSESVLLYRGFALKEPKIHKD